MNEYGLWKLKKLEEEKAVQLIYLEQLKEEFKEMERKAERKK
ncbi:hypothetical protein [Metabacillus sp. FJAT-52054]|uniref:Transposase n=1 Tax=Metabacillus sediminis TaxID=3117746 RepID=A0ABZ2NKJ6_9BACI